ncbi:PGF-CTERM sorting domain-containing protein [Natrinema sp. DC36]|uniref:DUF7282 domain-containing protein n=1 Tax=Natrinema sp. DC36 TaxID=2878680 RepID=UPI001CF08F3F|nr:PGF-CTERM sorting domain-containing protein [Natrinema sp. DC36]
MTELHTKLRAAILATLMIVSVFAAASVGGAAGSTDATTTANMSSAIQSSADVQEDSLKVMTVSWFRDDGDGNGPYPVPPNEYEGNDSNGIHMFGNAKGDDHIAVDNSTAKNPNGKWDMVALNIEVSADTLEELEPASDDPAEDGVVTQEFLENENWDLEISQDGGDKTLDIAENQENFEPAEVAAPTGPEIPPVMVLADTEEVQTDYMKDGGPDTSLYVWIDPNRATLDENGEEASFETGESYNAKIDIHGQSQDVTFDMVEGDAVFADDASAPNTGQAEVAGESSLSANTDVEMVVVPEDGENQTAETTVTGNMKIGDVSNPGTVPRGTVSATFNLAGMENQELEVYVYGEGGRGSGDFEHLLGSTTMTVDDVIDPNYTIEDTVIRDSKPLTIAYTNPDHKEASAIANQVGDGHLSGDSTIAKNVNVEQPYFDEMFLHYETGTEVFPAIEKSPGADPVEQFTNSPLSLDVTQTNANGEPKTLDLEQNSSGVFLAPDNDSSDARLYNGTEQTGLFFSFKLNDMVFFQDGEKVEPEIGDEFEATLSIETEAQGTIEETITFEIVEGKTVLATDDLELTQSDEAEVTFNSTMARGTAMDIRLVAEGEDFDESTGEMTLDGLGEQICCDGPNTDPWGTISATFDTSDIPQGTELHAEARIVADLPSDYETPVTVAEADGQIVEPPSGTISVSGQSGNGESITIDSLELSDGGFVSVHRGSPTGATVGSSAYLETGTHTDLSVDLGEAVTEDTTLYVLVHTDSNDNEQYDFPISDDPYPAEDSDHLSASFDYTVESSDGGDTSGDDDGNDSSNDGENSDGTPGFGISVALTALLAAGFLLYRRD